MSEAWQSSLRSDIDPSSVFLLEELDFEGWLRGERNTADWPHAAGVELSPEEAVHIDLTVVLLVDALERAEYFGMYVGHERVQNCLGEACQAHVSVEARILACLDS